MTKEDLIVLIDSWENLSFTINEISNHPENFDILMDIALNHSEHKSWRAAYLADKIHDVHPELLFPYIEILIQKLKVLDNKSKKRHFLKLISMNELPVKYYGFLVDYCITTLSSEEPPANRVHAMQILYNISLKEPDLKYELIHIIEHEMEYHATPGIISRGNRLLNQLHKL